jgi:hypothetical protein
MRQHRAGHYQEVIAVSAFADFDGAPGGSGPSRCGNADD